jgi:dipeptidyl aminopeptidase/acylaminoacyl peptidase
MQHDLTDSEQWAIDQGIANPDNILIYWGSFGGYATRAGLTFTPNLFKCGRDIVGPSNIKTLLDSIPANWGPLRNDILKKTDPWLRPFKEGEHFEEVEDETATFPLKSAVEA